MTTVPLSDAKARLSELADDVHRTHDRVNVTRNGREYVVIMSAEDLDSLEATIELLADQAAQRRVEESEAAIARGDYTTLEDIVAIMEQRKIRGE